MGFWSAILASALPLQGLTDSAAHVMLPRVKPSAKSLILDLLQSLRGRSMPVRALVEAAPALRPGRERRARGAGAAARARAGRTRRPGPLSAGGDRAARLAPGRRLVERRRARAPLERRPGCWRARARPREARSPRAAARRPCARLPGLRASSIRGCSCGPTTCAAASPRRADALHELGLDPRGARLRRRATSTRRRRRARAGSGTAPRSCARSARRATEIERSASRLPRLAARGGHGRDLPRRRPRDPADRARSVPARGDRARSRAPRARRRHARVRPRRARVAGAISCVRTKPRIAARRPIWPASRAKSAPAALGSANRSSP